MNAKEMNLPSYYAWHPVVESKRDVLSVLLTRGTHQCAPISGKKFAAAVASAAGVTVDQVMFGCDEFVTSYFSDAKLGGQWEECWDMRLLLARAIGKRAVKNLVAFPIEELPDSTGQVRDQISVRVIADFESLELSTKCKHFLQERALAQTIRWPDRYSVRNVEPHQQQLCIEVGTLGRSRLDDLLPDATKIAAICRDLGGRTYTMTLPPERHGIDENGHLP